MAVTFPEVVSDEEFDMRDDKESINTAIDLGDKYANIESDSENEQDSDSESHSNDPRDDLLIQVKGSLPQRYGKEVSRTSLAGRASGEIAKAKVFNVLLLFSEGRCEDCSCTV